MPTQEEWDRWQPRLTAAQHLAGISTKQLSDAERDLQAAHAYALLHIGDGLHRLAAAVEAHTTLYTGTSVEQGAAPDVGTPPPDRAAGAETPATETATTEALREGEQPTREMPHAIHPDDDTCGEAATVLLPTRDEAGSQIITLRCSRDPGHEPPHMADMPPDQPTTIHTWTSAPDPTTESDYA